MVFNNALITVQSISDDKYPPVFCNDIELDLFSHKLPLEPGHIPVLHDEWLTTEEREDKIRFIQCEDHIHASYQPYQP